MRCLVLTLALAVGAFAETRMIEIPNLDKFQSSRYKTLSFALNTGMKSVFFNTLFVFDTKEDEYEDLAVAFQCPAGDSFVFKYGFGEEILISKADTSSLKIPQNISENMFAFCLAKIGKRAEDNQLTKADDAFLRKFADDIVLGFKNTTPKTTIDLINFRKNIETLPPAIRQYYKEAIKKHFDEKTIDTYFKELYN